MQRWNDPKHNVDPGRQPKTRDTIVTNISATSDHPSLNPLSICCSPCNRNSHCESSNVVGVSATGPNVPFLVDGSIHAPTSHVHRHYDWALWRWSTRMLCYYVLDIFSCSPCARALVYTLHVDFIYLILILIPDTNYKSSNKIEGHYIVCVCIYARGHARPTY